MKEIVNRLIENRNIERAKSILESSGYEVSKRLKESAVNDVDLHDLLQSQYHNIRRVRNNQFLYLSDDLEKLIDICKSGGWQVEGDNNHLNVSKGNIHLQADRMENPNWEGNYGYLFTNPSGRFSGWYAEGSSALDCTITIEGVLSGSLLDNSDGEWEKHLKDDITSAIKKTNILTGKFSISIEY